jgi:uncharacterized protein (UPF0276 family)
MKLYQDFIKISQIEVPTMVEWDDNIPEFEILFNELERVKNYILL